MSKREYNTGPLDVRLKRKLVVNNDTECWIWSGSISPQGYGLLTVKKTVKERVHRLAYKLWVDPNVPQYAVVEQICGNKLCCNPTHLRVVEHSLIAPATNAHHRGEMHHNARFKTQDIVLIRHLYDTKQKSISQLARQFDVAGPTISRIVNRKVWRNVNAS